MHKICKRCRQEKPMDAFEPSARYIDGVKNRCRECLQKQSEYNKAHYADDPEHHRNRAKAWRKRNPEKIRLQSKRVPKEKKLAWNRSWREKNLEYARERRKEHYKKNRETEIARHAKWKQNNKVRLAEYQRNKLKQFPEKNRFARSLRRAAEKRATPSWANKKTMLAVYKEAVRLTALTGIQHHVDHIVPLQSPWVCGLHCEANLQILPYYENQSKSNRRWPDMPDLSGVEFAEAA